MKDERGRRLTRKQKILLAKQPRKLNPANWLCVSDDGHLLEIRHRTSGRVAYIPYSSKEGQNV